MNIEYWKNYDGRGFEDGRSLIDFLPLFQDTLQQTALDIGCGKGATSRFLNMHFNRVCAVDIVFRKEFD